MEIQDRILEIIEVKGFNKKTFSEKIGISPQTLHHIVGGRRTNPSFEVINKILSTFSDISERWLILGEGRWDEREKKITTVNESASSYNHTEKGIPLIPIDAMAGWGNGDGTVMNYEATIYNVPEFNDLNVDFMVRVKGSSMYPKYNSGDLVACKKLPTSTFFQWNKVYVIDSCQGALIKRVHQSEKEDHITLTSDNADYPPFTIPISEVRSLAIVVGVIRLE